MKIRDKWEPWLRDYLRKRYPELEPMITAAADAFDSIQEQKKITPELLAVIVNAASSPRAPALESVTPLLSILTGEFTEACDAVAKMAQDRQQHVRFNAILSLGYSTPNALKLNLLQQGLLDKSARVRIKAADRALRLRFREIIPELENSLAKEKNADAKSNLEYCLRLLRDGYILKTENSEIRLKSVLCHHGGIACPNIKQSEIDRRGLQVIVDEIASKKFP